MRENEGVMNPFVIIGGVLILLGGVIVGKMTFRFFIFVLKILFGSSLIYFGYLITKHPPPDYSQLTKWIKKENIIFYSNSKVSFTPDPASQFEVFTVFMSTGEVDLSAVKPQKENIKIIVNSLFSDTIVIVDPNTPIQIHTFIQNGTAEISGAEPIHSGDLDFSTNTAKKSKHILEIQGHSLFGKLQFLTPADLKPQK